MLTSPAVVLLLAWVPTAALTLPELSKVADPDPITIAPVAMSLSNDPMLPLPDDNPFPLVSETLPPVDADAVKPIKIMEDFPVLLEEETNIVPPISNPFPVLSDTLPDVSVSLD